jgi:hypothetical protein
MRPMRGIDLRVNMSLFPLLNRSLGLLVAGSLGGFWHVSAGEG